MNRTENLEVPVFPEKGSIARSLPTVSIQRQFSAAEIKACLSTKIFGKWTHVFEKIDSTNEEATRLAEQGAKEGTLVLAECQTKGRGRLGRTWHSPAGLGIWMSVVLRPKLAPIAAPGLSLVAGLSLARTIEECLQTPVELKWPNDCLLGGKKTAGILAELSAQRENVRFVVLGVGVNVLHQPQDFPPELQKTATSLVLATGQLIDRVEFLCEFLKRLEADYSQFKKQGLAPFIDSYTRRCELIGSQIQAHVGHKTITGQALRIDATGALVLRQGQKEIVISAGEAQRIR